MHRHTSKQAWESTVHCGLQFSTPLHILGPCQCLNQIATKPALAGTTCEFLWLVQSSHCCYHNRVQACMLSGSAVCLPLPALQLWGMRLASGARDECRVARGIKKSLMQFNQSGSHASMPVCPCMHWGYVDCRYEPRLAILPPGRVPCGMS